MIVFTCEDTFEAMMTCIYEAWASKAGHKNIKLKTEPIGNLELFCEYRHTDGDMEKCRKSHPGHSAENIPAGLSYGLSLRCL